jgi:hypothetical protein
MESDDFFNQESIPSVAKPEVPEKVRDALREGVATAVSEQNWAQTVNDLIRTPWLMEMVVNKAMDFVEQTGVSLEGLEASVSGIIAEKISELLPEEPGEEPDSTSVREPRKPILPTLLGSIALALPNDSAETA